jgi:hypothetical protein
MNMNNPSSFDSLQVAKQATRKEAQQKTISHKVSQEDVIKAAAAARQHLTKVIESANEAYKLLGSVNNSDATFSLQESLEKFLLDLDKVNVKNVVKEVHNVMVKRLRTRSNEKKIVP